MQHVVPPSEHHVRRIRDAERRGVARAERNTWRMRLVRMALFMLVPIAAVLLAFKLWSLRLVADGLVRANVVTTVAPSRVRVAEVFVEAGQSVRRGDPLARLEALDRGRGLRARELALEEALLRLAVIESGGDLGEVDLARRSERLAEATRRVELARASTEIARSKLAEQLAAQAELEPSLTQARQARSEAVARMEASLAGARGEIDAARARQGLLEFDAVRTGQLTEDGFASERARLSARSELDAASAAIAGRAEAKAGLERELAAADQALLLEAARGPAALAAMDARVARARQELEAAVLEEGLWLELLDSRRQFAPEVAQTGASLRALELELAHTAVQRAQAELDAFDFELGHGLLRAEKSGRLDRIFVEVGAVVDQGAPIARLYDPAEVTVFAWVDPDRIGELELGGVASVVPSTRRTSIEGRITSIDQVWSLAPEQLPHLQVNAGSFMVPVGVECSPAEGGELLVPNMRVQVVFRTVASRVGSSAAFLGPR